jgi:hypothetical protein
MKTKHSERARLAADEVFERGSRPEDIRAALAALGDDRQEFLDRLAVRSSLHAASEDAADDTEGPPASLTSALLETYDRERERAEAVDLSEPSRWLAVKEAFGSDIVFIMKLVGRQIRAPTAKFLRDAADALGVAVERVKEHLTPTGDVGLVGVERKAAGKPTGPRVESFETAVRGSKLPEELKKRWLPE